MKRDGKGRDVGMSKGKEDGRRRIKEGEGEMFMVGKTSLFVGCCSSC